MLHVGKARAWDQWALTARAARRATHRAAREALAACAREIHELNASLRVQSIVLDETHDALGALEVSRREERARLGRGRRPRRRAARQARELRAPQRANASVLAQFAAAEAEFYEAERVRAEAPLVHRIVQAVFPEQQRAGAGWRRTLRVRARAAAPPPPAPPRSRPSARGGAGVAPPRGARATAAVAAAEAAARTAGARRRSGERAEVRGILTTPAARRAIITAAAARASAR